MLPPKPNLSADQRRLLKLYAALNSQARESLLDFAGYLAQRDGSEAESPESEAREPKSIPRPDGESVVAAIKRLSESYYMLDRSLLLTETSSLMTAHIMHGRSAPDVIDELEQLFSTHYQDYLSPEE